MARVPRIPTTAITATIGAFSTSRTQRSPSDWWSVTAAVALRAAREPGRGASRPFANPIMAGSMVRETRIARRTAAAADTPMPLRNGMSTTSNPSSAMMTVTPAKTTALPAVATAVPADSSGSMPLPS